MEFNNMNITTMDVNDAILKSETQIFELVDFESLTDLEKEKYKKLLANKRIMQSYLENLTTAFSNTIDPTDPTVYNSLYQLDKYYTEYPMLSYDKERIMEFAKKFLEFYYKDMKTDYEGELSFEDFIKLFIEEENENPYGGNGSYNFHILTLNKLRSILRLFN